MVYVWHDGPPSPGVLAATERLARADGVLQVAVMPDAHVAPNVCVGTAVATSGTLYPNAVGGDIGCGMAAIAFFADASVLDDARSAAAVLGGLNKSIPFIRHRAAASQLPPRLRDWELSTPRLEALKRTEGESQLGTLGSGNHFVELQEAEDGRLWLMLHSGSRGMGQAIRDHHLEHARPGSQGPPLLDADSAHGRDYLNDAAWAVAYAEASRSAMVQEVVALLSRLFSIEADVESNVTCHHNHVREERHGDSVLFVHRKGAISADEGELGLVPGSMGTGSVHVVGRGCAESLRFERPRRGTPVEPR